MINDWFRNEWDYEWKNGTFWEWNQDTQFTSSPSCDSYTSSSAACFSVQLQTRWTALAADSLTLHLSIQASAYALISCFSFTHMASPLVFLARCLHFPFCRNRLEALSASSLFEGWLQKVQAENSSETNMFALISRLQVWATVAQSC